MNKHLIPLLILAATAAQAANYDLYYLQERSDGKTEKRKVTLTPGTYLNIDGSGHLQVRTTSQVRSDLSVSNVENTALSTWAGSTNLTTLAPNAARNNLTAGTGSLNLSLYTLTLPTDVSRLGSTIDLGTGEVAGTLSITNGGTGSTTAAGAFGNIKQTASTSATGVVQIATNGEVQTGTDSLKSVVSSSLSAWWTWIKTQTQTIAGNWIFNGNVTAGDASGDSFSGSAGTVSFPNATSTASDRLANVGALQGKFDTRYALQAQPVLTNRIIYVPTQWAQERVGLGAVSPSSGDQISYVRTTTSGDYSLLTMGTAAPFFNTSTSSTISFAQNQGFLVWGRLMCGRDNGRSRVIFGGASTTTVAKTWGTLDRMGVAMEFQQVAAVQQARLLVYTSSGTVTGSWVTISISNWNNALFYILIRASDVALYTNGGGANALSTTPLTTVSGLPGGSFHNPALSVSWFDENNGALSDPGFSIIRGIYETNGVILQ